MRNTTDTPSLFIADRIRETRWPKRQYIRDLQLLWIYVQRGGPHSYSEAMQYHQLKEPYRAELRALQIEHAEGRHVDSDEFRRIRAEEQRRRKEEQTARRREEQQRQEAEQRAEQREYQEWLQAGGRL